MRNSLALLLRRTTVGALALAGMWAPTGALAVAPVAASSQEAGSLPFAQRYRALQHGGIVRAANVSITCRTPRANHRFPSSTAPSCPAARQGATGVNGDFDMTYVDVDKDPNTYNSSRAEVRVPEGSRVSYARLYWGGNLRVGEQKPPKDNGRVLVAEPGGEYKEVLADTVVGHRVAQGADAFQASADVTRLVRESGPGLYTVAQVNVAMGRSAAGAWGGWTLVVAYENPEQPLRHLAVWDGFDALKSGAGPEIRLRGMRFPTGAGGRAGLVTYDGDHGATGDTLTLTTTRASSAPQPHRTEVTPLTNSANPRDDVLNSTISEPGASDPERVPAYTRTLGYDSDVFDLGTGLRRGGDQLAFRVVSQRDRVWAGVLFVAVDALR
ncbi:DUF3344 domain-containing protein [Streptomyces neyagawaensis]|uniref:DUF3344 domain-containing protein n=1 Tax=Streptomyces neyagawaensis TaxID=42238 RepID=UPI0006E1E786|nr:DUF3344 domain-containing protein [Streptomyces neyagawaensis]MCL6733258.1 DUF3344 domain-containing protein [Streptomyces neyagawaensis]MDE1685060.1 DUF3344 domain-containing protein [Streptomyces neyagawaensis]